MDSENKIEQSTEAQLRGFIEDHRKHFKHVRTTVESLSLSMSLFQKLDLSNPNKITYLIERAIYEVLRDSIHDLVTSLINALEENLFSTVEALSRVIAEHTVNFIYIFEDETGHRASCFLKSYFSSTIKQSKKWKKYAKSENLQVDFSVATNKVEMLEKLESSFQWLHNPASESWPEQSATRFKEVGVEGLYRTLYAATSDTIHSLSEDCFNRAQLFLTCGIRSDAENDLYIQVLQLEKASFAIFCAESTAHLVIQLVQLLSQSISDQHNKEEFQEILSQIEELMHEHDITNEKYSFDRTTPLD